MKICKMNSILLLIPILLILIGCSNTNGAAPSPTELLSGSTTTPAPTEMLSGSTTFPDTSVTPVASVTTAPTGITPDTDVITAPTNIPSEVIYDGITWQSFVQEMGMGWNLGNTYDPNDCTWLINEMSYETAWGNVKTTQEIIDLAKDQGFNTIRISVSWHNHISVEVDENGRKIYTISDNWMNRIQEVVDYCYNDDLYVVIDVHHDDASTDWIYPTEECKESSLNFLTQIWEQIAKRFSDYDLHLVFQTMNEVRLSGTSDEWNPSSAASKKAQNIINEFNQACVNTIRTAEGAYNQSRFILCPGYCGSPYSYPNYKLPSDPGGYENRIMVSIHPYVPYTFCGDVSATGKSVYDSSVLTAIKDVFRIVNDEWTSKDIPVIIDEWGVILKTDNQQERIKYVNAYITQAVSTCKDSSGDIVNVPCILWDNGDVSNVGGKEVFGYMDRKNLCWLDQEFVDMIINTARDNAHAQQ